MAGPAPVSEAGPPLVTEIGPPPPLDPELAAALAPVADLLRTAPTRELLPLMRQQAPRCPPFAADELTRGGAFTVQERIVSGPPGAPDISLLICLPTRATRPTAALYRIHGGGMIVGDSRAGIAEVLDPAQELGLAVVSVEYRLAPETPHPGPVEDCYAGLEWLAAHAWELGIDPDRLIVAGRSAGGGLAAGLALLARDRRGPVLLGQLLMSPMLDDRNDSVSARQLAGRSVWDRAANEFGWTCLLGADTGGVHVSAYAAPARAADLSGLAPAFVDVGTAETFRDEDVAYASGIWQAGGVAELHVWPGGFHGFDTFAPGAHLSRDARAARVAWLRRLTMS